MEQRQELEQQKNERAAEQDPKLGAREMKELIRDDELAAEMQLVVDVCTPMIKVLRLADGDKPCMSKLYHRMFMLEQWIKAMIGDEDAAELMREQCAFTKAARIKAAGSSAAAAAIEEEEEEEIPELDPAVGRDILRCITAR